jgi:hypothetical protein
MTNCNDPQEIWVDILTLENPKAMTTYCQSNDNKSFRHSEYEYNSGLLVLETQSGVNGIDNGIVVYTYNADNLLKTKIETSNYQKNEYTYLYNGDKQLISIDLYHETYFEDGRVNGVNQYVETYEYKNNLLVKKTETWGGTKTYEYDSQKRLIKENVFYQTGEQHSVINYTYNGNLKKEEWQQSSSSGNDIYHYYYQYNSNNLLTKTIEKDKTIEENIYDGNKLIEKRVNYYGIDPGYYFCLGNYIYKYDY